MSRLVLTRAISAIGSLGFGQWGVSLFGNTLPATPFNVTAVNDTGGFFIPGDPVRRPSFQVLCRNISSNSAYSLSEAIFTALMSNEFHALGCDYPGRLIPQHLPGPHYVDANNHTVFTLNWVFVTTKK